MSFLYRLSILVLITLLFSGFDGKEEAGQIMRAGSFHGDEVTAQTGEEWDVLYSKDKSFFLEKSKITVEIVEDPIVDERGEKTGKKVTVDVDGEPILLLNNIPNLTPGKISASMDHKLYFFEKDLFHLKTGNNAYELKMLRQGSKAELIYSDGTTDQVLKEFPVTKINETIYMYGDEAMPSILWSGDLDGDNIPDLLLDISHHYNLSEITLFLSSQASKGEIVKKAAVFSTVGC